MENLRALEGYAFALGLLSMEDGNSMLIYQLSNYIRKNSNKEEINKLIQDGFDRVEERYKGECAKSEILAVHLIVKNPLAKKNISITNLANRILKKNLFNKEETHKRAVEVANYFYGIEI